ncbi:MAG: hypothetical protein ABL995_14020 [Bryobacteraceae bacterium]
MKVTRRGLARLAAVASAAATIPQKGEAQAPPPPAVHASVRSAAAFAMEKVKLPRATEPAMRFEA